VSGVRGRSAGVNAVDARLVELLRPERTPRRPVLRDGYLDLLGSDDPTGGGPGQRLMVSRVLPVIYERLWRPLGGRLLMGALGPSMSGERRIALELLEIAAGDAVLDVACGPGNFTRAFADAAGPDGLVVGLDASRTMLAQAARERPGDGVEYVRASATDLPFADGSFDAVACRVAAHHFDDVGAAIREMARVAADRVLLVDNLFMSDDAEEADRVRDASHIRNYTEAEWRGFFEEAGLLVDEVRHFDKPIELEPWLERAGCAGEEAERVRSLLADRTDGDWIRLDRIALRGAK
jgi:ubiquinone/menaquinone biosynthesis C-methylase UbiE